MKLYKDVNNVWYLGNVIHPTKTCELKWADNGLDLWITPIGQIEPVYFYGPYTQLENSAGNYYTSKVTFLSDCADFFKSTTGISDLSAANGLRSTSSLVLPVQVVDSLGNVLGIDAASTLRLAATKVLPVQVIDDAGNVIGLRPASNPKSASTNVLVVQPIDETGAIIKGGGASLGAQYISPADFTATYTSASTITLTGVPFTLASGVNIVYIKVRNSSTNVTNTYVNGSAGYAFAHSAGVVTAYLNGVAVNIFTANDMYEMGLNNQLKSYDSSLDITKVINQSPDRASYVQDSLVDTTNVAAATGYYPSATGMSMDGYKDLSLTGKIIEGDAVTDTLEVQATNDEDTTNADWVTIYGYRSDTNAISNIVTTGGAAGTYTFAWDFDNLNYSYFRVKYVMADSTNTVIIKARRKSL